MLLGDFPDPPKEVVSCSNCEWEGSPDEVNDIKDILMRVLPGEIMPYGECPECGCLCHGKKGSGNDRQ